MNSGGTNKQAGSHKQPEYTEQLVQYNYINFIYVAMKCLTKA
jgi:hypothetical protein